jgi:hypothetical protein
MSNQETLMDDTAREEAIRRIVVERDFLYSILTRIVAETHLLQDEGSATSPMPLKQRIYMFTVNAEDHHKIQDLLMRHTLGRMPTMTPLPPKAPVD